MHTLSQFRNMLILNGFTLGNQQKDFGGELPNVDYFMRILEDESYQYVTLVSYLGEFCEAIYERFPNEKNTRDKKQVGDKMIYRGFDELKNKIESSK